MNWIPLENETHLNEIISASHTRPQVIFKFSRICDFNESIRYRLEQSKTPADVDFHFLDLIGFRALSNKVAADFGVTHQSPQVLMIVKGECVYNESHNRIRMDAIEAESMGAI